MFRIAARIFIAVLLIATAQAALAEKRVALVIGNDKYANLASHAQLERAVNDARAVSRAFRDLGFEVTELENASRSTFNAKWQQFLLKVSEDDVGEDDVVAFYFSGHGIEVEGLNFLIPSDIPNVEYGRQEQIKRESISVSELLLDLKKRRPGVSLLILDACREHPLIPDESRSAGPKPGGLAKMDAPNGTFIMYSAGAGQTALDRLPQTDPDTVDSVFTRKLLPLMRQKGIEIAELAREVRKQVHALAATVPHEQTPAYYDGVLGKFCLAGCEAAEAFALPKDMPPAEITRPDHASAILQVPLQLQMCDGVFVSVAQPESRLCIKPGSGQKFRDCAECPEMVIAPSGGFTMGSPDNEPERSASEGPQHKVSIAQPFAVGRYAVTFEEWDACAASNGCGGYMPRDEGWGRGDRPVINVNLDDAKAYVAWLSKKTGQRYRLLSEAEFEYVVRAGTTTPFWWGSSMTPEQANFDGNHIYAGGCSKGVYRAATVPANYFEPNPWGLYQVHGNVWNWVEDCWRDNYEGAPAGGSAWTIAECKQRVLRGGSWQSDPSLLRAAHRLLVNLPKGRSSDYGFRVARTLD